MKLLVLVMFLLSGCSVYRGNFDCPPGPSVGCEPVSLVNDLVNENALDEYVRGEERQEFSKDEIQIIANAKHSNAEHPAYKSNLNNHAE